MKGQADRKIVIAYQLGMQRSRQRRFLSPSENYMKRKIEQTRPVSTASSKRSASGSPCGVCVRQTETPQDKFLSPWFFRPHFLQRKRTIAWRKVGQALLCSVVKSGGKMTIEIPPVFIEC